MPQAAKIQASESPIQKVFSDDYAFTIPGYQRPYAWTVVQAGELLDDLTKALDDGGQRNVDDLNPYFLGSIVLVKGSGPEAEIIDGQQRLTTLTILLAVIRSRVSDKLAVDLTTLIKQSGNLITGTPDRYRLTLRESDADFFRQHIQDGGGLAKLYRLDAGGLPDSQQNIRDNARLVAKRLESSNEERLVRLARFVATRCFLVVVSTSDFDSAYRIFSVLNTRGLDLLDSDILKAELIGKITPSRQDQYTQKWVEAEENLGRGPFNEIFSHIRMIHRKVKAQETTIKEIRDHILPTTNPTTFIDDEVIPYSKAYYLLRVGPFRAERRAEEVNRLLRWLRRVDNIDWIAPAISFISKYRNEPDALAAFLTDIERLAAGLWIRGVYINERIERYWRLLTEIATGDDLTKPESALQLTADECTEITKILDGPVYLMPAKVRFYVLLRLDEALTEKGAEYDRDYVTVEHVLPQKPPQGSKWLQWFPEEAKHENWVHRVGNLVLLSQRKNSAAYNYEFDVKKATYFAPRSGSTPFALTAQVLSEPEWTPAVLERRQASLLEKFKQVWRL